MSHGTDSSTRLDDHDHEHDPRDPVYADDVRDEAYHDSDETERDTELDAAGRPDATDTVDDEDARDDEMTPADEMRADEMRAGEMRGDEMRGDEMRGDETRADEMRADETRDAGDETSEAGEARYGDEMRADDETRVDDEARDDEVTRGGDPFGVNEANRERDAFQADEADYEVTHTNRVDGEAIAVPAGPIEADPPTAVAVAPVNAADQPSRDEVSAYEAGTDRDAVEAANAQSGTGTVYGTGEGADAQSADNGPIVAGTASEAQPVHDEMKPGSVEPAPVAAFWNEADAEGIRNRWRELQLRFIDDPESVAGEAERLVEEAVAGLAAALNQAKQDLGDWRDGQGGDTERLRAAVRGYRDFLDRLLGL